MKHIDEHTLELYILGEEKALRKNNAIEKHLQQCAGCRELAKKMQTFYADVNAELENLKMDSTLEVESISPVPTVNSTSLVHAQEQTDELWYKPKLPIVARQSNIEKWTPKALQKFWFTVGNFVYHRPIVATASSLALLGVLALLINLRIDKTIIDDNPAYYHYKIGEDKFEVYNKENKMLWALPGKNLETTHKWENKYHVSLTSFADINGDKKNEVITALQLGNDNKSTLKAYNNAGVVIQTFISHDRNIQFRQLHYNEEFGCGEIIDLRTEEQKLNFLIVSNAGRSPNCLIRLDSNFNIIGKYWHFGNIVPTRVNGINGKEGIVALGTNDVGDVSMNDFPMMTILDLEKLIGEEEASATRGFGFKKAQSEMYYIRFPRTDIEKITKIKSTANAVVYQDDSTICVNISNSLEQYNPNFLGFDYIFNKKTMSVITVKFVSNTERTHQRLKAERKLHSIFDDKYLENLKNNVEYWDGEKWDKKMVMVKH
ncbi:MAG: hypothetical protein H3C35_13090 [Bacteroidetes bacterium]|nr:hypothetical protein [Bacteroidota bacterium]